MSRKMLSVFLAAAMMSTANAAIAQADVTFIWEDYSIEFGSISWNGDVIVAAGGNRAFNWDVKNGYVPFAHSIPGQMSWATGMNASGSIVAGYFRDEVDPEWMRAVRWTGVTQCDVLAPVQDRRNSIALCTSSDGSVLGGSAWTQLQSWKDQVAVAWINGASRVLGTLPTHTISAATAVTRDGQTLFGYSGDGDTFSLFRWTNAAGMTAVPMPTGTTYTRLCSINADGSVIVGSARDTTTGNEVGFIWTQGQGPRRLITDPRAPSFRVTDASADGSIVVGAIASPGTSDVVPNAFWTPSLGVTELSAYLAAQGVSFGDREILHTLISDNGDSIACVLGFLNTYELFRISDFISSSACPADFNHDAAVNSQDFFDFLGAFFAANPAADFNLDATVNSQDFFDFLNAFFVPC